jgi:exosortase/archaeosortase family protein
VGFVLVSVAFAALIAGTRVRKTLWLLAALLLLWLLNAVRVLAIFGVAHEWGRSIAIDWLHPYAGVVMFNIALLVMLVLLGRFGLHLRTPDDGSEPRAGSGHIAAGAIVAILVLALVGGVANARLDRYDLAAGEPSTPTRSFVDVATASLGAGNVHPAGERRDASAFFAEDASWLRYDLAVAGGTVRADVIRSTSPSALATFGTVAFVRSPATALRSVDAQAWTSANGAVDVAWLTRVAVGSSSVTEQIVLSGRDRATLLRLAGVLAGDAASAARRTPRNR